MSHPSAPPFVREGPGHQFPPLLLAALEVLLVQSFPGAPDFRHDHHVHRARVFLGYQACHVSRADMSCRRKEALNKTETDLVAVI